MDTIWFENEEKSNSITYHQFDIYSVEWRMTYIRFDNKKTDIGDKSLLKSPKLRWICKEL